MQCVFDFLIDRQSMLSSLARERCSIVEFSQGGFSIQNDKTTVKLSKTNKWSFDCKSFSCSVVGYGGYDDCDISKSADFFFALASTLSFEQIRPFIMLFKL